MKTSQWHRAVENRCIFSARLNVLSDRSGDRSAGGRRFHVAGPLTVKLYFPVAVRARELVECNGSSGEWHFNIMSILIVMVAVVTLLLWRIRQKLIVLYFRMWYRSRIISSSSSMWWRHTALSVMAYCAASAFRVTSAPVSILNTRHSPSICTLLHVVEYV